MTENIFSVVSVDVLAVSYDREKRQVRFGAPRRAARPFAGDRALPGVVVHSGERLREAADRAVGKLALPLDAIAIGQLRTFDEPSRDPRGPSLSVAMWAVYPALSAAQSVDWFALADPPGLAFDHDRIVADGRRLLGAMLWHDLDFTRALTGPEFTATDAVAITAQLTGRDVHRANLNRDLARTTGLAEAGTAAAAGGRPPKVWRWSTERS